MGNKCSQWWSTCGSNCFWFRWRVKTVTDLPNENRPVKMSTIKELSEIQPIEESFLGNWHSRRTPEETQLYCVTGIVQTIDYSMWDLDIHIRISDEKGSCITAEVPNPKTCIDSTYFSQISETYNSLYEWTHKNNIPCGDDISKNRYIIIITGFLFYDYEHDAFCCKKKGSIELHPAISVII